MSSELFLTDFFIFFRSSGFVIAKCCLHSNNQELCFQLIRCYHLHYFKLLCWKNYFYFGICHNLHFFVKHKMHQGRSDLESHLDFVLFIFILIIICFVIFVTDFYFHYQQMNCSFFLHTDY